MFEELRESQHQLLSSIGSLEMKPYMAIPVFTALGFHSFAALAPAWRNIFIGRFRL